ncbi:adenylyltransferase [Helicobacter sp. 16-1353]|uniref:HesA/MoeB/ThiF family protein n=1 Tax=Helicobacter sp. 16-1353 TaxID=2004996 RepID=UPI000DCF1B16|nr:HesA/MoeB/ThiF family protein [Helicobacter sp. 16-1353]RAX53163.1 adenylyltransferase [Helicobacter sp. 16-1353]
MLSEEDKFRYTRHLMLDEVGEAGQEKLMQSSVLIIGAGGLGSPNAFYLTAAGIGRIGLVDFDKVDLSNLQRQILHNMGDLDNFKVDSALQKLQNINDKTKFDIYKEKISASNILDLIAPYDFIIDATDNFAAKFLINDACILGSKPLAHSGIYKFCGQAMTILPKESACFACAFEAPPPKELNPIFKAGLFGVIPGVLGCIQASEAIKYFLNTGDLLLNTLLSVDLKHMIFRKIDIKRNPNCRICGENGIKKLIDY